MRASSRFGAHGMAAGPVPHGNPDGSGKDVRNPGRSPDHAALSDSEPVIVPTASSGNLPEAAPLEADAIPSVDELALQDVSTMKDEELMRLCQEGDEGAFEVLFERYQGQALSFIHRLIGDPSRTEALGQEAFMRIFKDAKSYEYPRSFTTWFYTIVRNLCKNDLRWRSRHPTVSIEDNLAQTQRSSDDAPRIGDYLKSHTTDPLEEIVHKEMNEQLEKALQSLPEQEREVLILHKFQGLKYREIAEIVGVPIGTVRLRIYASLDRLRKSVKDYL